MNKATFIRTWLYVALVTIFLFQNCSSTDLADNEGETSQTQSDDSSAGENSPDDGDESNGNQSCLFNEVELKHGDTIQAYREGSAERCQSEARSCENGNLSGSFDFPSCTVQAGAKKSCLFNGRVIAHGASVEAFLASSVASGQSCAKQVRVCEDGSMSGAYLFSSCSVNQPLSCSFNGQTIAHGTQVRAYLHSSSSSSGNLCSIAQNRVCNNGALSGSYTFPNCNINKPRSCTFDGRTVSSGQSVRAYEFSNAAFGSPNCNSRQNRVCTDGNLSGSYRFASCVASAPASCLFNGRTIPHGGTAIGYASSTGVRGTVNACAPITRTCNNGALNNTGATFASCSLAEPKACLFNDKTIPHGGQVQAFTKANNGGVGKCVSQTRTCQNGVLSGAGQYESCVHTCRYGRASFNENQIILYRMHSLRGECTDSNRNCRVFQPALVTGYNIDGSTVWSCHLAGIRCTSSGNGHMDVLRYTIRHRGDSCGNPMMSTPINPNTLLTVDGTPLTRNGSGGLLLQTVDRSNTNLLWSAPYRLKGPLP